MPMTFPAHQGLILPVVRRWPNSFDALALSVGAAMPDVTDTVLSFPVNKYFRQWYGHSLIGIFTLDLAGGLFITWSIRRVLNLLDKHQRLKTPTTITPPTPANARVNDLKNVSHAKGDLRLLSFSIMVGILSHIGFDLISHDTNLLFYPWRENVYLFPKWWYTTWFEIPALHAFGRKYLVGPFSIVWGTLTVLGTFLFLRFLIQEHKNKG